MLISLYHRKKKTQKIWEAVQSVSKWLLWQAKLFHLKPSVCGEEKRKHSALKINQVFYEMIKLMCTTEYATKILASPKPSSSTPGWRGHWDSGPLLGNLQIFTEHGLSPCGWEHKGVENSRQNDLKSERVDFQSLCRNYLAKFKKWQYGIEVSHP